MVMVEKNQALLHITTLDYSFVAEHHMARLFSKAADLHIREHDAEHSDQFYDLCAEPGRPH